MLGHILALLNLRLWAIFCRVTHEAYLLLGLVAVRFLEFNAFLVGLDGHNCFAGRNSLWLALNLVDICTDLLRLGLAASLAFNRPTLLTIPVPGTKGARRGKLVVNTGCLVSFDADLLRLNLTVDLLVVKALCAGRC